MTRKHYEQLAKMIRQYRLEDDGTSSGVIASIADHLACLCEADNPRFDRARFNAACGLDEDGLEWVI